MEWILNIGAEGLVLLQEKTQAETKNIIQAIKYSPLGRRDNPNFIYAIHLYQITSSNVSVL